MVRSYLGGVKMTGVLRLGEEGRGKRGVIERVTRGGNVRGIGRAMDIENARSYMLDEVAMKI
jgi:hypothetical protein